MLSYQTVTYDITDNQAMYDPQWNNAYQREEEINPGYVGIGKDNRGVKVGQAECFLYALEKLGITVTEDFDPYHNKLHKEFKEELEECFYSGEWIYKKNIYGEE